jgi:adenylosuccinate synthase
MNNRRKADIIVDLQFGSTGKGLIAGYLSLKKDYEVVVNANMPNAGHTFMMGDNIKMVHKVLPSGVMGKNTEFVMIGPGSVFDPARLYSELQHCRDIGLRFVVLIHEAATVLQERHKEQEQNSLNHIASTMQGSMAAMVDKMSRSKDKLCLATDVLDSSWNVVSHATWLDVMDKARSILIEGAQGYSLGINSGFWPYCTSRDCGPARFLSDCGVPHAYLNKVIGSARLHPIRVGNTPNGFSGPGYPDQEEIEWADIGVEPEVTTVTNRVRRVFSFSRIQMKQAIIACQPTNIFLNFCNYAPESTEHVIKEINNMCGAHVDRSVGVSYTGWGPKYEDIKEYQDTKNA